MIFSLDFPAGFTRTITANALSAILFYNNTSEKHYNSTITQTAILFQTVSQGFAFARWEF